MKASFGLSARNHVVALLLLSCAASGQALAAQDCVLAQKFLAEAEQLIEARYTDEALPLLRQSVTACPSFRGNRKLGDVLSRASEESGRREAAAAYVSAHELANSDKDRAQVLFSYATLLVRERDPQNAYPLAIAAQQLDPADAAIGELVGRLEQQVRNPSADQLVRGLGNSLFKPLRISALGPSARPQSRRTESNLAATVPVPASGPSLGIRINFETGTVNVDEQTRPNVAALAQALANSQFRARQFLFVGHADARGSDGLNRGLSLQRAEAIYREVLLLEPSLKGRITVEGRGASEPLDLRDSADAHRANRRLQVVLK